MRVSTADQFDINIGDIFDIIEMPLLSWQSIIGVKYQSVNFNNYNYDIKLLLHANAWANVCGTNTISYKSTLGEDMRFCRKLTRFCGIAKNVIHTNIYEDLFNKLNHEHY